MLARSLEARANIHHTRRIIKTLIPRVGTDWESVTATIRDLESQSELLPLLQDYLANELQSNHKAVSYFIVPAQSITGLAQLLCSLTVANTSLFPSVLDTEQLPTLSQFHTLVARDISASKIMLTLTRRKMFTLRRRIETDAFSAEAQEELSIFNEVYGVTEYNCQLFDTIVFHFDTGLLEVRADVVRGENYNPTASFIDETLAELIGWLRFQIAQSEFSITIETPLNLFPAIEYFNRVDDGLIERLNFATAEGSVKKQTMKKGEDLRLEVYHRTGMDAIGHQITPFEISIFWERTNHQDWRIQPEITIPSSYRVAVSSRTQTYAIVSSCPTAEDSAFLVEKLLRAIEYDHQANLIQ